MSKPLVRVCSAVCGTQAARVMAEIHRLHPEIAVASNCCASLYLEEVHGCSFSLKYKNEDGVLVLPIGRSLPYSRVRHAAESIIAMICRGENWQDKNGRTYHFGWGSEHRSRKYLARPYRSGFKSDVVPV